MESKDASMDSIAAMITSYLGGTVGGYDTEGQEYSSLMDMWKHEGLATEAAAAAAATIKEKRRQQSGAAAVPSQPEDAATIAATVKKKRKQQQQPQPAWYSQAYDYWEAEKNCPATVDGVLGGFGHVTGKDVEGSLRFLEFLRRRVPTLQRARALDCGAGIGRVTRDFLLPCFDHVDLLEQSPRLIGAAPAYIGEEGSKRVSFLCQGMQDFRPADGTYDVVWIQWCIGHLHDVDLVEFLHRANKSLKPGGLICVKDNCSDSVDFVLDKDDSSVTRSAEYLKAVFKVAGLTLLAEEKQEGFPEELFPVFMFAFTASPSSSSS